MTMDIQLVTLAAGASVSVLLIVLAFARTALSHTMLVESRLAALGRNDTALPMPAYSTGILHQPRPGASTFIDRTIRRSLGTGPRRQLDRAGIHLSLGDFFMLRSLAVATCSLAAVLLGWSSDIGLPLLAGGGAACGLLVPAVFLQIRIARRSKQTERQLVEFCEVMSTMLASGFGYMQALQAAAEQVGRPLGEEIGRFLDAVHLGADFDRALAETRERLNSADFEVVATALEVQRRTGGNLSEILRGVGHTIRERQAFQQELTALTSRERFSAIIIAIFPLILVGMLTVALPDVFGRLFTDPTGRIILGAALAMDLLGYLVARRLAKLEL